MTTQNLLFFDKKGEQYNFAWNGSYWEGSILFPVVSEKLFEVEHIFVIEKFLDGLGETKYGFPHSYGISPGSPIWRTRWENDYDGKTNVSSIIYTYELGIDTTLDAPVLVKANNVEFYPEVVSGDTIASPSGIVVTSDITSSSMQVNIALTSNEEGIYDRTLIFEDYTDPNNPVTILKVNLHGEVEGEDSRLSVLLDNFGRSFMTTDSFIVRDTDIKEPLPDFEIINKKRKELLLTGESIFPYLGSYKSLFNAIKFFGYYDLRVKEYWLNVHTDTATVLTPLQQNNKILKQLAAPTLTGESSLELISSLLKDENEGKFKHVEIYGKRKDGTFGLKKQFEEVFPSKSYKKTSLFGLFYDINREVENQDEDQYGYPIVEDAFLFSPEEVLLKLFGLKERLKRDYLPLNARIVDITGEGIYFNIYKTRGWVDQLGIDEVKSGIKVDFSVYPGNGYVEDLRPFYIKPNQDGLLYPAVNGTESGISYYGNTIEPYSYYQEYPVSNIPLLTQAIQSFYKDVENGEMPKFLGDGDYDPPGYKLFSTGEEFVFPAGCPVIIKDSTFTLAWDELSRTWDSLDATITTNLLSVASYTNTVLPNPGSPLQSVNSTTSISLNSTIPQVVTLNIGTGNGWFSSSTDVVFVRIESTLSSSNLMLGYVNPGDYNTGTGILNVQVISVRGSGTYSSWKVSPTNLTFSGYSFDYFENFVHSGGFYSWARLPYLDFYEIEWTIYKEDERPYYFQIRGALPDLETLPHFLPYTGEYNVQCRVWDTLNSISLGIKRSVIKVDKKQIELNTITRYRESEIYDWDNMPLKWESYPSQWIWPVENTDKTISVSDFIQNFPEYSNNFNEGQSCEVLSKVPEVKATAIFDLGANSVSIINIQSAFVSGGYSFATVTTTTPHGYSSGDFVWIFDSLGAPYGNFPITVTGPTTFEIPQIVITPITGGLIYGAGTIKVIADGVTIAECGFQGDLTSTASTVYYLINTSLNLPKCKVITLLDSVTPGNKTFTIQAPNNSGALWNGKVLNVQTTGCLFSTPINTTFSGGVNETEEYKFYDFNNSLPTKEMKYWGTKRLSWDTFEDFEFGKAYAHTWDMFDYHNDWLGGFDLYSLQYGDRIRVTSETDGVVLTEISSPSNSYLGLGEAAEQLNSSQDENIKRFNYIVRGFSDLPNNFYPNQNLNPVSPDLSTDPGPKDVTTRFFNVPFSVPGAQVSGLGWDGDGDIWISGTDVIRFDGLNYTTYDSTNSVMPTLGGLTNCIKVDRNDVKWIGVDGSYKPLVRIDEKDPSKSYAFDVTDFVDNSGTPVCANVPSTIYQIETNTQNGDIFASFYTSVSPGEIGLLYYDATEKSWHLFNANNSDITPGVINTLKLEHHSMNRWYLWIGTNTGISRFDGVSFKHYDTSNSGLPNDYVYSIEIDKLGHKWIGTQDAISYWDGTRWAVWNSSTNPELDPTGQYLSIVDSGNSNVWFVLKGSGISLWHFDGYFFTKVEYRNDNVTPIDPTAAGYGNQILVAPWKTVKNGETFFPKSLFIGTQAGELGVVDYIIPHIHATSTNPGTNGWDFIYHETSKPLPSIEYIHNSGIGQSQLGFNFILGPLNDNITLNSDYTRPVMAHVDRHSWYKPIWQRYPIDYLKDQFPSLNIDDVFLYAPLRDILNGKATKESYWRNSQIERIAQKKSRDLLENFEWVVTLGDIYSDIGVKLTVDSEGDIIALGNFEGSIFMGETNNINPIYLSVAGSNQGVYLAKYNKGGVLQWAYSREDVNASAGSVTTDANNNIYFVWNSDNGTTAAINIHKTSSMLTNMSALSITATTGTPTINDIKVDKYENVYICGEFEGTINLGTYTLTNTGSSPAAYLAKIDSTLSFVWAKQLGDGTTNYNSGSSLALLKEEYLYLAGKFTSSVDFGNTQLTGVGTPDAFIAKINTGDGNCIWKESLASSSSTVFTSISISVDPKGHVLLTGSFEGTIGIENQTVSSFPGTTDIFVIKLLSTGKLMWMKMCGGSSGDFAYDIESDSDENVYITGAFSDEAYFSPDVINPRGIIDIYLTKFNKDGQVIDIVTAGGALLDAGLDIVLDDEENVYITGYFEGDSDFSPYISIPGTNSPNAFIGKIPKQRFREGYKIGSVQSWFGSHSWSWREERFYDKEFEIPLATTIFINPIDSLIPGKKNHVWTLTDSETGKVVANIRKTPYFIWTFTNPGFYTISCSLQDANGNSYDVQHKGKIRVIDHKTAFAGDLIPDVVNPEDFLIRSIYQDREEMGFPPLNRFNVTA